jgi:hypothetical protein
MNRRRDTTDPEGTAQADPKVTDPQSDTTDPKGTAQADPKVTEPHGDTTDPKGTAQADPKVTDTTKDPKGPAQADPKVTVPHITDPKGTAQADPRIMVDGAKGTQFTLNLSNRVLTESEKRLLDRGLTFIPVYTVYSEHALYGLQNRLVRSLKLKDYYRESDDTDYDPNVKTFVAKSGWTPRDSSLEPATLQTIQDIVHSTESVLATRKRVGQGLIRLRQRRDNLEPDEREALKDLQNDSSIVIKPADKGSATVIMSKSAYLQEGYRQLDRPQYYRKLDGPMYPATAVRIHDILRQMNAERSITDEQLEFLRPKPDARQRRFYMLPKIHKPRSKWPQPDRMPEGRPIVSDTASESYEVASFIDYHLKPLSVRHFSYLKDTYDFVSKIRGQRVPAGCLLVTGDVTALYTNMTIDRMMDVTRGAFARYPVAGRPDARLLELLDLTLRSNDFVFNGEVFLQVCGIAMGKDYAPSEANLYLEKFDDDAVGYEIVPLLYFRFLDDVFFVWTGTVEQLKSFEAYLNTLIPGIKITLNWSPVSVDFLDTTVYLSEPLPSADSDVVQVELRTKVFFKETDTHQLLHKGSFHPRHCCRGILKSQMLRFRRLSSCRHDYNVACATLMKALSVRGYNKRLMREVKLEVWQLLDANLRRAEPAAIIPVIVPFNELGCRLNTEWRNAISQNAFFASSRVITAYTVGHNLQRKLVRSLVTDNPVGTAAVPTKHHQSARPDGCRKCVNTRCRTCNLLQEGKWFRSCRTGKRFQVRGAVTCTTRNLVYLIGCRKCNLQYVGETGLSLRDRVNCHLSCIRKTVATTPLAIHWRQSAHRMSDLTIQGIEVFPPDASAEHRKLKETTWQNLLQTCHPMGINRLTTRLAQGRS